MATVALSSEARDQFDELPKKIKTRVLKKLEALRKWPEVSGVKALSGELAGCCRVRTGDYRIRFQVVADKIIVDKIGHRDKFYED
jgi:mRNA-degrading endonuclease RelE of RelBE toxin-antitoxin system